MTRIELGNRISKQIDFAKNKVVQASIDGYDDDQLSWEGYVLALRWVETVIQNMVCSEIKTINFMGITYDVIGSYVFKNGEYRGKLESYLNGDNELGIKAFYITEDNNG